MFLDRVEKRSEEVDINDWKDIYSFEKGYDVFDGDLKESTYFKCIKILSESVAKMPINLKMSTEDGEEKATKHYLYDLLRNRPNEYMSAIDFWKAMEATRQHKGESFALITRDSRGKITGLYPIDVSRLVVDNIGLSKSKKKNKILVEYSVNGTVYSCLYSEVLHFKGFTLDGINSYSVKETLNGLIDTNKGALSYQRELFKSGLTNKVVIQMTSDIKEDKELKKIQDKFNKIYSSKGRVFTVPAGYSVSPLNLSLADSQFEQLKKLNAIDLGTAFGVPPYMLGFIENYNNNSLEQSSLSFLVNTLLVLITSIEQELNYKLLTQSERNQGYYFEFNQGVLLRVDSKTQAEILNSYVAGGVKLPNEARVLLGLKKLPEGDDLIVNAGVYKLKDIGKNTDNDA